MLLFLTYLKSENICTKRYFTAEKNAESIFFFDLQECKARSNLVSKGSEKLLIPTSS